MRPRRPNIRHTRAAGLHVSERVDLGILKESRRGLFTFRSGSLGILVLGGSMPFFVRRQVPITVV